MVKGARRSSGFSAIELLLSIALLATLSGIAIPLVQTALDEFRAGMAARYLAGRVMNARMLAVRHSARVGLRFDPVGGEYWIGEYLDGNGNGIRSAEISAAIDTVILAPHPFRQDSPGTALGLLPGIPDLDDVRSPLLTDGVRLGVSRILTVTPDSTASSGTIYVHGGRAQYAVRVLGATARTRVWRFDRGTGRWTAR